VPGHQDRVETRAGNLNVLERQAHGASRHVDRGEVLIASLVPTVSIPTATPTLFPPQAAAQIAQFEAVEGQVRLTRFNTTQVTAVDNPGVLLFNGDRVQTLQGRADIRFTDQSLITMEFGTDVIIEEQQQPTGLLRRVTQSLGSLWFNIQQVVGTETELNTPTAVAAIRGTEGTQVVPNDTQSTHALNQGLEDITERVTGQTVSITDGQRVTAIRGVGFTPIVSLLAAIPKPGVGAGAGGGGGGGAAGGGAAGGGGGAGAATGAAAGAATSTVSTVATVAAAGAAAGAVATATIVPLAARDEPPPADAKVPLNFPGGEPGGGPDVAAGSIRTALIAPLATRDVPPASASVPSGFPGRGASVVRRPPPDRGAWTLNLPPGLR